MAAIGYATLPVVPSLKGVMKELNRELSGDLTKAAKNAGNAFSKGFADGVKTAERALDRARAAQESAARKVIAAEQAVEKARIDSRAMAKSVEAAEKQLIAARVAVSPAVENAERKLTDLRNSGKASAEQIALAEQRLAAARASHDAKVLKLESQLETARGRAQNAATKLSGAEAKLKDAKNHAGEAAVLLKRKTEALERAQKDAKRSTGLFAKSLAGMKGKLHDLGGVMGSTVGKLGALGAAFGGGFAITGFFSSAIEAGRELDTVMGSLKAVTGSSAEEMAKVAEKAKQLGVDETLAGTSAASATEAMLSLARGGLDVGQAMDAAKGSIQLAGAAQISAGEAADLQIAALNSFGLAAGEAGRVADVLTNAANRSATTVPELGEALKMAAPTASTLGASLEDTTTMIGLFANNGIKGTMAGTAMRSALLSMTSPSKQASKALGELGVEAFDSEGKFVGLSKVAQQLQDAQKRMGDSAFTAAAATAFGREAVGFATTAAKGGAAAFDELRGKMDQQGSAGETAGAKLAGLNGAMDRLSNMTGQLKQNFYELIAPKLTEWVDEIAGKISDLNEKFPDLVNTIGGVIGNIVAIATTIKDVVATVVDSVVNFGQQSEGVKAIVGGIAVVMTPLFVGLAAQWLSTAAIALTAAATHAAAWIQVKFEAIISSALYVANLYATGLGWIKTGIQAAAGAAAHVAAWVGIKLAAVQNAAIIAAQWVIAMGPIGIAVAAIGVISAALYAFFTQTEVGQRAWAALTSFLQTAWENVQNYLSNAWNTLKNAGSTAISFVKDKFTGGFNAIKNKVREFTDSFKNIGSKIKGAFSGAAGWLKDIGKSLIRGLVDGIKSVGNMIGDAIKSIMPASIAKLLPFANGGILLPFANGGVRERHEAQIAPAGAMRLWAEPETGGEAYIPLAASKRARSTGILATVADKFGLGLVDKTGYAVRAFANGGVVSGDEILKFASGEEVGGVRAARSLEGSPYVWGGSNWGDCSGTSSALMAFALGINPFPRKYATGTQGNWLAQQGAKSGKGGKNTITTAWFNGGAGGGHTSTTLQLANGKVVNLEMGGGRGNGQIGGSAASALSGRWTDYAHVPLKDSVAGAAGSGEITNTSVDGVTTKSGQEVDWGTAREAWEAAKHSVGLFDTGGVLKSGNFAFNASGRPERILNPRQTQLFEQFVSLLGRVAGGVNFERAAGTSNGDVLAYTKLVRDAEQGLAETRREIADDSSKIREAEEELARLQTEASRADRDAIERVVAAERRLAKAREKGNADKIHAAEHALTKAREKVPESSRKIAEKITAAEAKVQAARDDSAKASKKIAAAELAVKFARVQAMADIATSLVSVVEQPTKIIGELGKVTGNHVLQFAGKIVETVEAVGKKIWGWVSNYVDSFNQAKTVLARLYHEHSSGIREMTAIVSAAKQQFIEAGQALIGAAISHQTALLKLNRERQNAVKTAETTGKKISDIEARLAAARLRGSAIVRDLTTDYARYRRVEKQGMRERLVEAGVTNSEIQGLEKELAEARLAQQQEQKDAALQGLQAALAHRNAIFDLLDANATLETSVKKLQIAANGFGEQTEQALIREQIAKLNAENAELEAKRDSAGAQLRRFFGKLTDWNGDGKFFGLGANTWSIERKIYEDAIEQNNARIRELTSHQYAPAGIDLGVLDDERSKVAAIIRNLGEDAAKRYVSNSSWGRVGKDAEFIKFLQSVEDTHAARVDAGRKYQRRAVELEFQGRTLAVENGDLSAADTTRKYIESNQLVVSAGKKLDAAARAFGAKSITVNVPNGKTAVSVDELEQVFNSLDQVQGLEVRLNRVESTIPHRALAVADARRKGY